MLSIKGFIVFIIWLTMILLVSVPGCDNDKSQANDGPEIRSYSGYLMYGDGGFLYKTAPDGNYNILYDEPDDLLTRYNELTFLVHEPVFAKFKGYNLDATVMVRDDYGGAIKITEVDSIDYVTRDLRIFPLEFKCYGEEPFWSIDVIIDDEIIFKDLSREHVLWIPYSTPTDFEGTITYELEYNFEREDKQAVLILEPSECFDTMSGERFAYTATFEIDGDTYHGCAEKIAEN